MILSESVSVKRSKYSYMYFVFRFKPKVCVWSKVEHAGRTEIQRIMHSDSDSSLLLELIIEVSTRDIHRAGF